MLVSGVSYIVDRITSWRLIDLRVDISVYNIAQLLELLFYTLDINDLVIRYDFASLRGHTRDRELQMILQDLDKYRAKVATKLEEEKKREESKR